MFSGMLILQGFQRKSVKENRSKINHLQKDIIIGQTGRLRTAALWR